MKKIYGVLGHPVAHSLSPAIFEAAFWQYNIEAEYLKFDVSAENLKGFIAGIKNETGANESESIEGLSVTIPYKEAILPLLDAVDEKAKLIGAVNTVVKNRGKLKGYNTDWIGAKRALEEAVEKSLNNQSAGSGKKSGEKFLQDKRVLVLGAGGAAAAIVYACVQAGAQVTILNRTIEKAQELAARFSNCKADTLDTILQHPADVLIHTTSVGMARTDSSNRLNSDAGRSLESLVPPQFFKKGMVVFDIVYNPLETKLVKEAREAGCRIVPGYKMLLYQAEKQFELWFKKRAPIEAMEKALLNGLLKRSVK